jgi:hypothetical protein
VLESHTEIANVTERVKLADRQVRRRDHSLEFSQKVTSGEAKSIISLQLQHDGSCMVPEILER